MWHSTLNINLKWQTTLEVEVCRISTQTWLWLAPKSISVLKVTFFSPNAEFWALSSPQEVTNTFSSTGWPACNVFPPLVPLKPAQQLFTDEAVGCKPMRGFMQIECARYFNESCLPARTYELVDPQWWYMQPYPNAWLQDKVITLLLVYSALPFNSPVHGHTHVCTYTRAMSIFSPP